jgi:hypothetical protein
MASAVIKAVIAALLGLLGTFISKHYEGQNALQLKRLEFKSSLILQAVKTDDIEIALKDLYFFIEVGILDDEDGKIKSS